ncbi:MAG: serine hydrolase, partial [Lachnospiraceae bacterium]|nr:serine hydrolase [Lachnospiraceae bacterium]
MDGRKAAAGPVLLKVPAAALCVCGNEKETYPVIHKGTPEEAGIREEALSFISDIIETDIKNGFTSAQLAVIRNGRLVYENAWGRTSSFHKDGTPDTDSAPVTTDTLYDLASVTKMFSVNYALQKLLTDGK